MMEAKRTRKQVDAGTAFIQQLLQGAQQRMNPGMGVMQPQQAPLPQPIQPQGSLASPEAPSDAPAYVPPKVAEMSLKQIDQTIKELESGTGAFKAGENDRRTWAGKYFKGKFDPLGMRQQAEREALRTKGTPQYEEYRNQLYARRDALMAAQAQGQQMDEAAQNLARFNLLQGLTPGVSPVSELEGITGNLQNIPVPYDPNKIPTTEAMRRTALSQAGAMMDPNKLATVLSTRQADLQSRELHPRVLRDKDTAHRLNIEENVRKREAHAANMQKARLEIREKGLNLAAWVPDRVAKDADNGIPAELSQGYWNKVFSKEGLDASDPAAQSYTIAQGLAGGIGMNMRLIQDAVKLAESAKGDTKNALDALIENRVGQAAGDLELWPKIKVLSAAHNIPTSALLIHADHIGLIEQMVQEDPRLTFKGVFKLASKNPEKFYKLMQSKTQGSTATPATSLAGLDPVSPYLQEAASVPAKEAGTKAWILEQTKRK